MTHIVKYGVAAFSVRELTGNMNDIIEQFVNRVEHYKKEYPTIGDLTIEFDNIGTFFVYAYREETIHEQGYKYMKRVNGKFWGKVGKASPCISMSKEVIAQINREIKNV